jgi:transposase-like protein
MYTRMPNKKPAKAKRPLTDLIFHDDDAAREHLEKLLWKNGPECPRCHVTGDRITFHVPNVNARTLRPIIVKHVSRKSHLMTDESTVYPSIGSEFAGHSTVNHSADEYVRMAGFVTTNNIESFFSLLKRGVYGNFHAVSEQHLGRYLREFDWRHNNRDMSPMERADALLAGAKGKRLLYHQPDQAAHA